MESLTGSNLGNLCYFGKHGAGLQPALPAQHPPVADREAHPNL
jgi:hypothetical protein